MEYFASQETERVQLDEKSWVDIKKEMSYGDTQKLAASFMKMRLQSKGDIDSDIDIETGNIELLLINIADWNLVDEKGKKVPVIRENIRRLKSSTAETILTAIGERNQPPKA